MSNLGEVAPLPVIDAAQMATLSSRTKVVRRLRQVRRCKGWIAPSWTPIRVMKFLHQSLTCAASVPRCATRWSG